MSLNAESLIEPHLYEESPDPGEKWHEADGATWTRVSYDGVLRDAEEKLGRSLTPEESDDLIQTCMDIANRLNEEGDR